MASGKSWVTAHCKLGATEASFGLLDWQSTCEIYSPLAPPLGNNDKTHKIGCWVSAIRLKKFLSPAASLNKVTWGFLALRMITSLAEHPCAHCFTPRALQCHRFYYVSTFLLCPWTVNFLLRNPTSSTHVCTSSIHNTWGPIQMCNQLIWNWNWITCLLCLSICTWLYLGMTFPFSYLLHWNFNLHIVGFCCLYYYCPCCVKITQT